MIQNEVDNKDIIEAEVAEEFAAVSSDEADIKDPQAYEIAYHFLSTIGEEAVAGAEARVRAAIESHGGTVDSVEAAKHVKLAYGVVAQSEGRNREFTDAYFGWVRATVLPSQIAHVDEALSGDNTILRHLIVRLSKDEIANPFTGFVGMRAKTADHTPGTITQKPDTATEASESGKEVSDAELDKAIGDIAESVEEKKEGE